MKDKKFVLCFLSLVLIFILSSCSSNTRVKHLSEYSFQYNKETNDYSLFFALNDTNKKQIAADANVDIKIINKADEVLYEKTVTITKGDFDYFTSKSRGKNYLANIQIPKEEVKKGTSAKGTVFFKVYNKQSFAFDECNCPVLFDLPIKDISITCTSLSKEVSIKKL